MSAAAALLISLVGVPPGEWMYDHNQPGQWGQPPVVRQFVRRPIDDARGDAWMHYCTVLDQLWVDYRASGSTPDAWELYKIRAAAAKRAYVFQDPYYVAQLDLRRPGPAVPPYLTQPWLHRRLPAPRPTGAHPHHATPWQSGPGVNPHGAPGYSPRPESYDQPAAPPQDPGAELEMPYPTAPAPTTGSPADQIPWYADPFEAGQQPYSQPPQPSPSDGPR